MDDFENSVMIALLPITTDWCKIECPHMTLVYCGEKEDLKPSDFNELAKDAASIAMMSRPIQLRVSGVEVFGEEDKVNVLKLQPTSELIAMRRFVNHWDKSEFPFKPHVTVGPVTESIELPPPPAIAFDRIMVGWGEDQLTFWLKR